MAVTSIAQRNIEIARKGYAAFNDADIATVMNLLADDVVWHSGGHGPLAGEFKGKEQVMDLFMRIGQLSEGTYKAELHDILANDQHTVVMGTSTGTRKGKTLVSKFTDVIHPDSEGRVKEFWRFVDNQAEADEWAKA